MLRELTEIKEDYNFLLGYHTGVQKKWWHGIEGITFIYMGIMSDPLIGYRGYAINVHDVEDYFWEQFQEDTADQFFESDGAYEAAFDEYLLERHEEVFSELNRLIDYWEEQIIIKAEMEEAYAA